MRVLLTTDGSEFSEHAAVFLTRFDFTPEDEIIVLHVISEIPYEDDYTAQVRHAIRRVAPEILADTAELLKTIGARVSTWEKEGYPDTTIIETAVESGCDLIVMGPRGVRGMELLVLGSSTRSVAINSPIPVLVAKKPPWDLSDKFRVLYAYDGSETAKAAGQFLASLPLPRNAEITVIYIAPLGMDIPERYAPELAPIMDKSPRLSFAIVSGGEKIISEAKEFLGGRFPEIHSKLASGDPFREILNAEKSVKPDMVIAGCRGLRGIRGMMGSVSRRLLSHSGSSILIGKACAKAERSAELSKEEREAVQGPSAP